MSSSKASVAQNKNIQYLRIKEYPILLFILVCTLIASSYVGFQVPILIAEIYESYSSNKEDFFFLAIKNAATFFIIQYFLRLIYQTLMSLYIKNLLCKLRQDLFSNWIYSQDKVITDDLSYFAQDRYTRGELQARMMNDAESIRELIRSGSLTIFLDFFFLISCMLSFFYIHQFYGVVLILTECFICILLIWISKFMVNSFKEVRRSNGELSRVLSSLSQGFKSLFYSKSDKYALKISLPKFEDFLKVQLRANFWDASYYSFAESLFPILLVVVVLVFPYSEVTSVAIFAALIDLIQRSIGPIKNVASKVSSIQRALTGIRRITELDNDLEKYSFKAQHKSTPLIDKMNFEIKHFTYERGQEKNFSLKNINASLEKGKKLGIIGQSGSGKSSILKILSGDIYTNKLNMNFGSKNDSLSYGGESLKDVNILRNYLCLVSQDSYLFSDTLEFNITFNNNHTNDFQRFYDEMMERIPYVKSWGLSPKEKINPAEISLGQKQLLSALRFCYQKKPIVLLDEISSALDGDLEQALSDFIDYIQDDVMMIIVAHRIETLLRCDQIMFLDKGEQIAIGQHNQLLKDYTDYANFFKMLKTTIQ